MKEKKSKTEPKAEPIYIEPISEPQVEALQEICAKSTHSLLALCCEQGLLLYDRRIKEQHLLTWEEIQRLQSK